MCNVGRSNYSPMNTHTSGILKIVYYFSIQKCINLLRKNFICQNLRVLTIIETIISIQWIR